MSSPGNRPATSFLMFVLNVVLCIGGTAFLVLFAFGLERKDSWANALLEALLAQAGIIIVLLVMVTGGIVFLTLRRTGRRE